MLTGRCLCGRVGYTVEGEPLWIAYCHCASCRRHTASPVSLFVGMKAGHLAWTEAEPDIYKSSPDVERLFCGTCGTPVAYRSERFPSEIHLYHGTLERPADLPPRGHVHVGERLPWFEIRDELPRYETTGQGTARPVSVGPREAGKQGE